jgi:hypothetical protein
MGSNSPAGEQPSGCQCIEDRLICDLIESRSTPERPVCSGWNPDLIATAISKQEAGDFAPRSMVRSRAIICA